MLVSAPASPQCVRANLATSYCDSTVSGSDVNPLEVAFTTMLPGVPVDRTMANALPLNAFRLVPLYDVVSMGQSADLAGIGDPDSVFCGRSFAFSAVG